MATVPDTQAVMGDIRTEFPSFKVVSKADSALMKAIDRFMRIVTFGQATTFMSGFTTTLGKTVYLPTTWDAWSPSAQCAVLRHERVHMRQAKRLSAPLYSFLYALVFLPLGLSWFRSRFEMEAYEESLKALAEYGEDVAVPGYKEHVVQYFITAKYGWMWPFKGAVERWYDEAAAKAKAPTP